VAGVGRGWLKGSFSGDEQRAKISAKHDVMSCIFPNILSSLTATNTVLLVIMALGECAEMLESMIVRSRHA
jgi:hypothetical protein